MSDGVECVMRCGVMRKRTVGVASSRLPVAAPVGGEGQLEQRDDPDGGDVRQHRLREEDTPSVAIQGV